MSRTRIITLTTFIGLVVAIVTGKALKDAHGDIAQTAYASVIPVSGFVLETEPFELFVEKSGTLLGRRESVLSAEVGGQIEHVYADVGTVVKAGQPLLRLDDELLELDAERAKIAFEKARLDFERVEKLFNEKSVSESDFENARLGRKSAEVQYRAAKKTYEEATIRAPFAGTITARLTEVGQMIDRGQPVFQLVDISELKLPLQISESELKFIQIGAPAAVFVEALGDTFAAEVTSIGARAMQGARTFPVELTMNGIEGVKSGMFARAKIFAGVDESSLVVPRAATLPDVGRTVVFVANGNKAAKKIVRILGTMEDRISISGLAAGDTVIVTGNQLLSQGSEINLTLE